MVEEGFGRWYMRTWFEQIAFMGVTLNWFLGPFVLFGLGAFNFILPTRKKQNKDFPAAVASRTTHLFSVSIPNFIEMGLMILYSILDVVQSPGGLKFSEASIDAWKERLGDDGWMVDITFYGWNWWNRTLISDSNRVDNAPYTVSDAVLDIFITILTGLLLFFLAKNFKTLTGKVGGIFGKQMSRRRRKKMKGLATETLDETRVSKKDLIKMLRDDTRIAKGISQLIEDDVLDDLDTIKRMRGKLRL